MTAQAAAVMLRLRAPEVLDEVDGWWAAAFREFHTKDMASHHEVILGLRHAGHLKAGVLLLELVGHGLHLADA